MGRGRTAQRERERKEAHPDLYCRKDGCLWRLSSGTCRKHGPRLSANAEDFINLYTRVDPFDPPLTEALRDRTEVHRQAPEDAE